MFKSVAKPFPRKTAIIYIATNRKCESSGVFQQVFSVQIHHAKPLYVLRCYITPHEYITPCGAVSLEFTGPRVHRASCTAQLFWNTSQLQRRQISLWPGFQAKEALLSSRALLAEIGALIQNIKTRHSLCSQRVYPNLKRITLRGKRDLEDVINLGILWWEVSWNIQVVPMSSQGYSEEGSRKFRQGMQCHSRSREVFQDATLLALKMEKGATRQGMPRVSRR